MRKCPKCRQDTDRSRGYCKPCSREYNNKWYGKKPRGWKKDRRGTAKSRRHKLLEFVNTLKTSPCIDCKNSFPPPSMDFDHLLDDKKDSIANLIKKGYSKKVILLEIAKCELVCSNCHRMRTWNRIKNIGV